MCRAVKRHPILGGPPAHSRSRSLGGPPSLTLVLVVCMAPACGSGPGSTGTRVERDGLGRRVAVPRRPERIVSLAPSVTASLLALGAAGRVVGVTDFCDLPHAVT